MSMGKKARREEAIRKAKRKKTVIAAVCMLTAVLITALLVMLTTRQSEANVISELDESAVDIDLTKYSSTIRVAEITKMMENPKDYVGKVIKVDGEYAPAYFDERYFHNIIAEITDACCLWGFEFRRAGNYVYPDDYPQTDARIEVTGVFGSYEELGVIRYYIAVDEFNVL